MGKTSNVFARVEPEIKEQAEKVLGQLGVSMSNAVDMFLRQVVLHNGIPFEVKIPKSEPLSYGSLTKEQFDKVLQEAVDEVKAGRVHTVEEVEAEMKRDFGI